MKHLMIVLLCATAAGIATASTPGVTLSLTVGNGCAERTLTFGLAPQATPGLDPAAGENELPPLPPQGAFDVRFMVDHLGVEGLQGLASDFRSADIPTAAYRINVQRDGVSPLTFRWDLPEGIVARLRDPFGGRILDQPVAGRGAFTYGGGALSEFSLEVTYRAGSAGGVTASGGTAAPVLFALNQNYPNPFNPTTRILYSLATGGPVTLVIYDVTGREVATLVDGIAEAGTHAITWDASDLAGGVYLARLTSAGQVETRRLVLLR